MTGNSDLSRIAFISIINNAVETVCTIEIVKRAFSATGVVPFNPEKN